MNEVLKFRVGIKGLENKIYREIEIIDNNTLMDLCCIILATFDLYSNEPFIIKHNNNQYDSVNSIYNNDLYKSTMSIKLKNLELNEKELIMEYNPEQKIIIIITYIETKKIVPNPSYYPKITDGSGLALDYISGEELISIVEETDKLGYSNYTTTIEVDGVDEEETFDYREFDLEENNFLVKCNLNSIKDDYENTTLLDILRIIPERSVLYFKIDTGEIVNPFDYIKKYLPKNYNTLTSKEKEKLNIPKCEDLNIYRLPTYEEINHKKIMTLYVKTSITDKEIRQALFYSLRNHEYMDKFYNLLRKYELFKEYLYFSDEYYNEIINNWKKENKIEG